MDIYHIELKEPDLNSRVISDLCEVAIAEKGATRGDGLRVESGLVLLFAQLKVKQKYQLRQDEVPEQDKVYDKYRIMPRQLSFLTAACMYSRDLKAAVDRAFIMDRRDKFWRYTVLDC